MKTIEIRRNRCFYVAYVQRETEKAYLCEILTMMGVFDFASFCYNLDSQDCSLPYAVKLNKLVWLPKSAVNNGELAYWLAYKLDFSGSWEGVPRGYPNFLHKSAPTQEAVVCNEKEFYDKDADEQENEDRVEQAEAWLVSQEGYSYRETDPCDLL